MKKLLLITSFLASQLFALECTEPLYEDNQVDRYVSYGFSADHSAHVFDTKSIKFDKKKQTIQVWTLSEVKNNPNFGFLKILYEFDIKNNNYRFPRAISLHCNGNIFESVKDLNWQSISPESSGEILLFKTKEYLNIKQ